MGTGLQFRDPARAAFAAAVLLWAGHGVLWRSNAPHVVMTSASQHDARTLIDTYPGTFPHWEALDGVDEGGRNG